VTTDADLLAHIQAVAARCRAGLLEEPPPHQGGYSPAWVRRQLLGLVDLSRVSYARLILCMKVAGFEPINPASTTYTLKNHNGGQFGG